MRHEKRNPTSQGNFSRNRLQMIFERTSTDAIVRFDQLPVLGRVTAVESLGQVVHVEEKLLGASAIVIAYPEKSCITPQSAAVNRGFLRLVMQVKCARVSY